MNSNTEATTLSLNKINILPPEFISEFVDVNSAVMKRRENLSQSITDIESKTCPIKEKKYLWNKITKLDTEGSLCAIYDEFASVSKLLMTEIKYGHDDTLRILNLVKLLAIAEVDIYKHLENRSLDINEIKTFFKDLCKENGIKDETVDALFNSTFERTYILRDRINTLKNDLIDKIAQTEKRIQNTENKVLDINKKLDSKIVQAIEDLNNLSRKHIDEYTAFVKYESDSLLKVIDDYRKAATELDAKVLQSFKESIDSITAMQNQLRLEIIKIQEDHEKLNEKKISDLEQEIKQQNIIIERLSKKDFFNSTFYKIATTAISISTLTGYIYLTMK